METQAELEGEVGGKFVPKASMEDPNERYLRAFYDQLEQVKAMQE